MHEEEVNPSALDEVNRSSTRDVNDLTASGAEDDLVPGSSELRHGDQGSFDLRDLERHIAAMAFLRREGHRLLAHVLDT